MLEKGNKLYSIFALKCPRCHTGDLFENNNPYNFRKLKMKQICEYCGQTFHPEPGFYFGAAYISYALNVALGVAIFILFYMILKVETIWLLLVLVASSTILLAPFVFVWSRSIWINMFIHYKPLP